MAFKQVVDLDSDVTTALGGVNRKTGKKNPQRAEGYFLGTKQVTSPKSKTGFAALHILQTSEGKLGVWGKTDMDRKMAGVKPGTMVRISHTGMQPTPNGEMYKFSVEVDEDNVTEAPAQASASQEADAEEFVGAEEEPADEIQFKPAVAPKVAARTPDADRQAKVKALLAGQRRA